MQMTMQVMMDPGPRVRARINCAYAVGGQADLRQGTSIETCCR
jgi:hypothetical protein